MSPAQSEEITLSVNDLVQYVSSESPPASVQGMTQRVAQKLGATDISVAQGIVYSSPLDGVRKGICDRWAWAGATVSDAKQTTLIDHTSAIKISARSLNEPISLSLQLDGHIDAEARIKMRDGYKGSIFGWGWCLDTFSVDNELTARLDFSLIVSATILLQPKMEFEAAKKRYRVSFAPHASIHVNTRRAAVDAHLKPTISREQFITNVTGNILTLGVSSGVGVAAESLLALGTEFSDRVFKAVGEKKLSATIAEKLKSKIDKALASPIVVYIPQDVYNTADALANNLGYPFLSRFVKDNYQDVLFAYLIGNTEGIKKYVATKGAVEACVSFVEDQSRQNQMTVATPPEDYAATSARQFCEGALVDMKNALGNPKLWRGEAQHWTLAHGAQLDLGVDSVKSKGAPYVKKFSYKSVATPRGDGVCELEMRVYKKNVADTQLRPLIALHGGNWSLRQAGIAGI
ncbi:MAG: hypothetical protein OEW08_01080, partial [Gammaproteobacteria bacterium]|nr:hypothetical protein [Gammaproteobacteria bacterium]